MKDERQSLGMQREKNGVTIDESVTPAGTPRTIAPLQNVTLFAGLAERLQNRPAHLPGIGVFYGFSGYGKTFAATYAAQTHQAIYIEMGEFWTRKTLCQALLRELTILPRRSVAEMMLQVSDSLAVEPRLVIIDEADHLIKRGMGDMIRSLHDRSGTPLIFIGEELLPVRLEQFERLHNRVLDWVAAEPVSVEDAEHLAKLYLPDYSLTTDLIKALHKASGGKARRVCVNLERVREFAVTKGLQTIGLDQWGHTPFWQGRPPARRRVA